MVVWSPEILKEVPEKPTKTLLSEAPPSTIDPEAPNEVLDLRLTFADDPEAMQQMADPQKAKEYMKEIIAQIREVKNRGDKIIRITGIPIWLAQGAYFAGARERMKRLIIYTLSGETIVYDADEPSLIGKTETKSPKEIKIDLSDQEQRIPITLDVHFTLEKNNGDVEKTALELAKEVVNKASEVTFSGITNAQELAIAGKVAHAAHGLIEKLYYQESPEIEPEVVKSWKAEKT